MVSQALGALTSIRLALRPPSPSCRPPPLPPPPLLSQFMCHKALAALKHQLGPVTPSVPAPPPLDPTIARHWGPKQTSSGPYTAPYHPPPPPSPLFVNPVMSTHIPGRPHIPSLPPLNPPEPLLRFARR